jgi:thiamine-phosphate pyrophosphorylase
MASSDEYTPAALRAIEAAAGYWDGGADFWPALLAGLVSEAECRAAVMLARRGLTVQKIVARWRGNGAAKNATNSRLLAILTPALRPARQCFRDLSPPPAFATEHLLLGLALSDSDAGQWLRGHGVTPKAVEAEIRSIYGHPAGPIDAPGIFPRAWSAAPSLDASPDQLASLRIVDAAANRASEGLRVVEDFARFVLDDAHLTRLAKDLRHELAAEVAQTAGPGRLAARDTAGDVGTGVAARGEYERASFPALLAANFQRTFQALRSLEEVAKLLSPAAPRLEALRYRAYTLERAIFATRDSQARLAGARLYVLLDGRNSLEAFSALASELVAAGAHAIQLRDKQLSDRELVSRARRLREITAGTRTLFILNDRPDLALLADADGVHVGQEELSVRDARRIVGPERLVGVSTHSIEQARQAVLDGASYLGVGPTFPSGTKEFAASPGCRLSPLLPPRSRYPGSPSAGSGSRTSGKCSAQARRA